MTPAPVVDFLVADFLVPALVVVDLRWRSGVVEMAGRTRGLELPVDARVAAISLFRVV